VSDPFDAIAAHLDALTANGRYLNAGLARIDAAGEVARVFGRVSPDGPALTDPTLRLRMASISKAATARAVVAVALRSGTPLTAPVADLLDLDLPGVTLDHLLSHTSGLTDHAGYLIDPPAPVAHLLARPRAISGPPGFFRYANLNYILLGMALERMAGDRFDRVLRAEVLDPAGIGGGFNWAGMADRRPLSVWQRRGDALTLEADGPDADWQAELIWRGGRGVDLGAYRIGRDTTLFSPHAGLRMNVAEAARLADLLATDDATGREQRRVRWRFDGINGEDCDGLFTTFGAGLTIYEGHDRIPGRLIGHAGHALGFTGGAWANRDTGAAWAYFLNGAPDLTEGQDDEAFYAPDEAAIMDLL
jgi:CubicO group peptidase (beta-lactamase class C family)